MTEPTQPGPAGYPPDATPPPSGYQLPPGYPPPGYPPPGHPQGYPPPGYPPPGYPPYPMYQAAPPFNTYAILSIIFAVAVLPPLGIYFGKKAKAEIQRTGERGTEMATAGIITGWILTSVMGLFLIVWCGFFVTFLGTVGSVGR